MKAKENEHINNGKKEITCCLCHKTKEIVDENVKWFKCSLCLDMSNQGKTKQEKSVNTPRVRKPRGWKFMKEFVDQDGNVYHRGVECPELKGTLEPTKIVAKEKAPKESNRIFSEIQNEAFAKINDYKNKIMSAYANKQQTIAHKLERELSAYKKKYKK